MPIGSDWTQVGDGADLVKVGGIRAVAIVQALDVGGSTQINVTSGNVAAATATATMPAAAGRTNFLTSFEITGGGATLGSIILATITGLKGGATMTYAVPVPAGVLLGLSAPFSMSFPKPLEASGPNVAIVVSAPSFGAGNTNAAVNAHGFSIEAT